MDRNLQNYIFIGASIPIFAFIFIGSSFFLVYSQTDVQLFRTSLNDIVNKSQNLTMSFQKNLIPQKAEISNMTLIALLDAFIPKFESLLKTATNMDYPSDFKNIHDALVNSLKFETEGYKHYRNYVISGNRTENSIYTELLSKAYENEQIYAKFLATQ
jgi:hypothetical protein